MLKENNEIKTFIDHWQRWYTLNMYSSLLLFIYFSCVISAFHHAITIEKNHIYAEFYYLGRWEAI